MKSWFKLDFYGNNGGAPQWFSNCGVCKNHPRNESGVQVWDSPVEILIQLERNEPRHLFSVNSAGDCDASVLRPSLSEAIPGLQCSPPKILGRVSRVRGLAT